MRWRLVAVFVGIVVAVLAAHDIPLALHLRQVERDRLVTALERDACTLAGRAEEALDDGEARSNPELQALVDSYRKDQGARVIVTDENGIAMVVSDEEARAGAVYATRPEIATALAGAPTSGTRTSKTLGTDLVYVAVPVLSGPDVIGAVRLTYPASVIEDRLADRVQALLVVAAMTVAMALAAAILLAGTVTRPLRELRGATERLAAGDLTVRAPVEGPVEMRSLASSFNTMSDRLAGLVEEQRAFAGDASHQLRTPLTALRLRLERAAELVDSDPEGARQRLEAAGAETERLQHLVDGLLALARADGRDQPHQVVDLAAVLRERAEVWQPLAEEQGIDVQVVAPAALPVQAIAGAVEQIIDNFVDNALGASPAGTTLELVARPVAPSAPGAVPRAELHVLDRGPGMSDEQRERAFDRFWRGGTTVGGSGLGLAIVAQLARASGGAAELLAREGGGIDAVATFEGVAADPGLLPDGAGSVNRRSGRFRWRRRRTT